MTREEAIMCIKHELLINVNRKDLTGQAIGEALDMAIEALQTDIVRCGECNEWNEYARDKLGRCDCHLITTSFDDFCSYGVRREANE